MLKSCKYRGRIRAKSLALYENAIGLYADALVTGAQTIAGARAHRFKFYAATSVERRADDLTVAVACRAIEETSEVNETGACPDFDNRSHKNRITALTRLWPGPAPPYRIC